MLPLNGQGATGGGLHSFTCTDTLFNCTNGSPSGTGYIGSSGVASGFTMNRCFFRNLGTAIQSSVLGIYATTQVSACVIDGVTAGSNSGIESSGNEVVGDLRVVLTSISNVGTAIRSLGSSFRYHLSSVSGTGNTTAISLARGSRALLTPASTITGTTELSIDGVASTIAAMRAASPKTTVPNNYGTLVYE
jgi:hypothetical protein